MCVCVCLHVYVYVYSCRRVCPHLLACVQLYKVYNQVAILLKYSYFQCVIHLWFCTIYLVIIIIIKACMQLAHSYVAISVESRAPASMWLYQCTPVSEMHCNYLVGNAALASYISTKPYLYLACSSLRFQLNLHVMTTYVCQVYPNSTIALEIVLSVKVSGS